MHSGIFCYMVTLSTYLMWCAARSGTDLWEKATWRWDDLPGGSSTFAVDLWHRVYTSTAYISNSTSSPIPSGQLSPSIIPFQCLFLLVTLQALQKAFLASVNLWLHSHGCVARLIRITWTIGVSPGCEYSFLNQVSPWILHTYTRAHKCTVDGALPRYLRACPMEWTQR